MSGVNEAIKAYNGLVGWINRNINSQRLDIGKPKRKSHRAKEKHLNDILIQFGKEHDIKMEPNNSPRYKGSYSPVMSNAIRVQKVFSIFTKWLLEKYPNSN